MGDTIVLLEYLEIYETYKLESGLWKSDVFVRDKQNVDAAIRILQPKVNACLAKSNEGLTKGLRVYLSIGFSLLRCFSGKSLAPKERARLAWQPVRLWKKWILFQQYDTEKHFISDQTYTDTILAGHSVILNMLIFAKYFPDVPFCPWFFGSDSCEVLFSYLRICEFYKVGTCKFLQQGFVEPAMTHWIGCDFPNCGKWWHELCLGINSKTTRKELGILLFVQSMTATRKNYSVLTNPRQHEKANQFFMEAAIPSQNQVNDIRKGKNNTGREIKSNTWSIKAKCITFPTFFLFK